jgi:hypothetical protein
MVTLNRPPEKRLQDIVDFSWMVTHSSDEGRRAIDLQRLEVLGEKVWPGAGGQEILRMVEQVRAGKPINLETLITPGK